MPEVITPKPQPCGSRLVRLADIPLDQFLAGYAKVMRDGLTAEEAQDLLALVLDPGEKSGRVAA